jgi:hypothetical protein
VWKLQWGSGLPSGYQLAPRLLAAVSSTRGAGESSARSDLDDLVLGVVAVPAA